MHVHERSTSSQVTRRLIAAASIGAAVVVPIIAMEWRFAGGFPSGVPVALFATLWLLATACCLAVWPTARRIGPTTGEGPIGLPRRRARRCAADGMALDHARARPVAVLPGRAELRLTDAEPWP